MRTLILALLCLFLAAPASAVQPDEVLDDPVLEARARAISKEVRCLVCRNESIDDSRADLARDLRLLVRERLTAGDTDAEVKQFLVDRYGEFVLLKPVFSLANALLWFAGPILFVLGLIASIVFIRGRQPQTTGNKAAPLTAEERSAFDRAMKGGET